MLLFSLLLLFSAPALGAHDDAVKATFWAFSTDSRHALVVLEDEQRGPILGVQKVGKRGYILRVPVAGRDPAQLVASTPFFEFGFADGGQKGPQPVDKKVKLMSVPGPRSLELYLAAGDTLAPLLGVPRRQDPTTGKLADVSVGEIIWTSGGHHVLVVVRHLLEGPYGLAVDESFFVDTIPARRTLKAKRRSKK